MLALLAATVQATSTAYCRDHVLFSLSGQLASSPRYAATPEELVRKIRFSYEKTVAIVVHGGLVGSDAACDNARMLAPVFEGAAYPIYLAWETGPGYALFPPPKVRSPKTGPSDSLTERLDPPHPLGDAERRLEHNTRGLGRSMWGEMKRSASYLSDPDNPDAALNRFMRAFAPLWNERRLRVVLIGHSAGALVIGNLIQRLDAWAPDAKVDVVFLAPACTYDFIAARRDAWKAHVAGFRMFALTDEAERQDALLAVPAAPKRIRHWYDASMLYYVSNNLEGQTDRPILGMERFWRLARGEETGAARELSFREKSTIEEVGNMCDLQENTVWSPSSGGRPGWQSSTKHHISFWADPGIQRSLREIAASPMK